MKMSSLRKDTFIVEIDEKERYRENKSLHRAHVK